MLAPAPAPVQALARRAAPASARQRRVEIAGHLVHELDRRRDVGRLDVDLQQRHVADPGLVLDLDRCRSRARRSGRRERRKLALHLPARALDAAERQRMILVDHALGHRGGGERQVVPLDHRAQQRRDRRSASPTSRAPRSAACAAAIRSRPPRRCGVAARRRASTAPPGPAPARRVGASATSSGRSRCTGPVRLAQREADRLVHGLGDAALLQPQRRLGDRREQRVVVDPHLDAAAELVGVEVAGDRDHRRAVEPGVSRRRWRGWSRRARASRCRGRARRSCGR